MASSPFLGAEAAAPSCQSQGGESSFVSYHNGTEYQNDTSVLTQSCNARWSSETAGAFGPGFDAGTGSHGEWTSQNHSYSSSQYETQCSPAMPGAGNASYPSCKYTSADRGSETGTGDQSSASGAWLDAAGQHAELDWSQCQNTTAQQESYQGAGNGSSVNGTGQGQSHSTAQRTSQKESSCGHGLYTTTPAGAHGLEVTHCSGTSTEDTYWNSSYSYAYSRSNFNDTGNGSTHDKTHSYTQCFTGVNQDRSVNGTGTMADGTDASLRAGYVRGTGSDCWNNNSYSFNGTNGTGSGSGSCNVYHSEYLASGILLYVPGVGSIGTPENTFLPTAAPSLP
ncbi:MAG: hypothetical protein ACYDDF_12570 [Thermoplasmatota archaeon]